MVVEVSKMSKQSQENPSMTMTVTPTPVDRSAARGEQFTPVCNLLHDFLASTQEFVCVPVTFDEEAGYLEWTGEAPKQNEKDRMDAK